MKIDFIVLGVHVQHKFQTSIMKENRRKIVNKKQGKKGGGKKKYKKIKYYKQEGPVGYL